MKIKEKGVWTTEAATVSECQCLKLQKIKGTRSSYGASIVLIFLHVKQVFTAASQAVSEMPNSLVECKRRKQESAGGP